MARASFTEAKKRGVLVRGPSIRSITEIQQSLASSMASQKNTLTNTHNSMLASVGEGSAPEGGLGSSATAVGAAQEGDGEYKCPWIDLKSDDGETYFWNTETDEVTWEMPEEFRKLRVIILTLTT